MPVPAIRRQLRRLHDLLRGSAKARYLAAGVVTILLNLLFLSLIRVTAVKPRYMPPEPEAVPLHVVDRKLSTPSERQPDTSSTTGEPGEPSPDAQQDLPAPQMPALELSATSPDPQGLKMAAAPGMASLELGVRMPAVAQPAPVASAGAPGVPGDGMGSGPMLLEPPDLSAYYPPSALRKKITGTTELQIVVDEAGRAVQVVVLQSSPGGVFDLAAQRLGQSLQFRPAQEGGHPVASRTRLTLHWTLD